MFACIHDYSAFVVSSFVFAAIPGIDTIFLLNKSMTCGRMGAACAAFGIMCGVLVHTLAAAFGLSAVFAASAAAFAVVKWMGVAYLCYLGIKALLTRRRDLSGLIGRGLGEQSHWTSFRQGLVSNVLNPKMALFVLAFFPQFIEPAAAHSPVPFLILGATDFAVGMLWYMPLALCASYVGAHLMGGEKRGTLMSRISGLVYLALGARIAAA
jgi:threonine/homoserine/homoserine lactone efflux protein